MLRRCVPRVCLVVLCLIGLPRVAQGQGHDKGWIDVNFGAAAAAEREFTSTRVITVSQETGAGSVAYGVPRGGSFDVGAGYMFTARIGVGVSLSGTAHEDTAGLGVSVPHPLFFNASAIDGSVTDRALTRAEGTWHLQIMAVGVDTPRVRVRVFGGPSYLRAEQETITSIGYDQTYQIFGRGNVVEIESFRSETSEATAWGVHVGGDVSVFFNRVVGVGGMVRISRGTAEIADYGGDHDITLGGVQFGGGLRFKF